MIPRKLDLTAQLKFEQSAFVFGPRGTGKSQLTRQYLAQAPNPMSIELLRSELSVCPLFTLEVGRFQSPA